MEYILTVALASLIEGPWRTDILILLVIGSNPYNDYAIFYGAPMYGDIFISPYSS